MTYNKPTHRRHNPWHNYSLKCIYHITLVVKDRMPILGNMVEVIEGRPETVCPWKHLHKKGNEWYGKAWMNLTPLGKDVAECIHNIPEFGKKKGLKQVKDVENAYIVRDDTEYASGQFLPLWSFGLLY